VITKGTAAGSPSAPATPAGNLKLYEVWIPATSGAPVAYDYRDFAAGPKTRAGDRPMTAATEVGTDANMLEVLARAQADGETSFLSSLRWDVTEDLPYIIRGKGGAGEEGAALYPLLSPAREWWRSVPFIGKEQDLGVDEMTSIYGGTGAPRLLLDRPGTNTHAYSLTIPIPVDARGLEVVAAKMRYQVTEAWDATITEQVVELIHVSAAGTATLVGSVTLVLGVLDVAISPETFSSLATPVIEEGDVLYAQLRIACSATGTAVGSAVFYGLDVQFKEART
jgi:hypothetical protein